MSGPIRTAIAVLALLVAATSAFTTAAPPRPGPIPRPTRSPHDETPTRNIAIAINGDTLAAEPAPRIVGSRVLVPVVRIYSGLGIDVARRGSDIIATAPTKKIVVHIGSSRAMVDGRPVDMGGPATEIDGATYVPLRFVSESIGAHVTYDAKAARVDVVSPLVGRVLGFAQTAPSGGVILTGNVTALDLTSAPATITITRGPSVRTISVNSNAKVIEQDTVSRTSIPSTINAVRVGDSLSATLNNRGFVQQIVAFYASRSGMAAAVTAGAVLLGDGRVITPDRNTEITLNDQPARLSDLAIGDSITVRSNPETGEKRQIIASRAAKQLPVSASPSAVKIDAFTTTAKRALRAGDRFDVQLRGTPGGRATFDIGLYVTGLPLRETTAGTYAGTYTVPSGVNFSQTSIYGHLSVANSSAPRAEAPSLISVSTTPPQITDIAPREGVVVNNPRPSIYATFDSPTDVGINPSSVQIRVNNLDVTASGTRGPTFVTYSPSVTLPDGKVDVAVRVSDNAGNASTRHWTFTIKSR